jgi:predicted AAA+ superfamily ATPase
MYRAALAHLQDWLESQPRKPLVLRGARQVGKTWLARELARSSGKQLIELNFERFPQLKTLFDSNDPTHILNNISAQQNLEIIPTQSLLFLDEIQVAPEVFATLRWFAEDMPELAIIAAGSLLEFMLSQPSFSMPVGRISYFYIEPLSFEEFLLAQGLKPSLQFIQQYTWGLEVPLMIHQQLMMEFKKYILIGGLPAAVSTWSQTQNIIRVQNLQHDLLTTYRDDFNKYSGKLSLTRLDEVLMQTPRLLGQKFKYSHVNADVQSTAIKAALTLLTQARLCYPIYHCAANGLPLGAEIDIKTFKVILLDVGLISIALGLSLQQIDVIHDLNLINKGAIAEQVVGQLLRVIEVPYIHPDLYYWQRDKKGSAAEIDYIIQHENRIIPIEVKSGTAGSLKSLHLFMQLKQLSQALRINSDIPSRVQVNTHLTSAISYQLCSIPFYLLGQIHRLLRSA